MIAPLSRELTLRRIIPQQTFILPLFITKNVSHLIVYFLPRSLL